MKGIINHLLIFLKGEIRKKKKYQLNIKPSHPISIINLGIRPAWLSMGSAVLNTHKKEKKINQKNIHMLEAYYFKGKGEPKELY